MKKSINAVLIAALGLGLGSTVSPAFGQPFQSDSDWTWSAHSNCAPPRSDSVAWVEENGLRFLRFQLRDGDIGNCPTDNERAHSERFNKPYSERAEWRGPAFASEPGSYELSFNVRFLQGFDQTRVDETFFQIKDCPTSAVPVMAKIGQWETARGERARIKFELGPGTGNTRQHSQFISNDVLDGEWHTVTAQFYTGEPMRLAVQIDGIPVLPETPFGTAPQCGQPSLRIGIYRPGDLDGNSHSIVDYDNVNVRPLPGE